MANPQPLHRAPCERSARRRVQTPLSPSCAKATYPLLLYLSPRRTQSAARKPRSPRCTIASGASHGRIRLTQPGRITQRKAVRAGGARQLKKHPGGHDALRHTPRTTQPASLRCRHEARSKTRLCCKPPEPQAGASIKPHLRRHAKLHELEPKPITNIRQEPLVLGANRTHNVHPRIAGHIDTRDLELSLISQIGAVRNGNRTRSSLIASMRIGLDGTRRLQTRARLLGPNNLSTRVGTIVMHLTAQVPISLLKLAPQLDESCRNLGEALP